MIYAVAPLVRRDLCKIDWPLLKIAPAQVDLPCCHLAWTKRSQEIVNLKLELFVLVIIFLMKNKNKRGISVEEQHAGYWKQQGDKWVCFTNIKIGFSEGKNVLCIIIYNVIVYILTNYSGQYIRFYDM